MFLYVEAFIEPDLMIFYDNYRRLSFFLAFFRHVCLISNTELYEQRGFEKREFSIKNQTIILKT